MWPLAVLTRVFFKITKCMVVLRAAKKSGRSNEVTVLSMWP